ncbi:MAG: hypothetical protein GXP27_08555, partial [Planctomycetes bacterium]|nr:hypothetical protein [Planctomycetota bacterium]
IKAYEKLLPRHIEVAWRVIHDSPKHKLSGAKTLLPPLAALGFRPLRETLLDNVLEARRDPLEHPASQIMMGALWGGN